MVIGQIVLATTFGPAGTVHINHYWVLAEPWQAVLNAGSKFVPGIALGGTIVF